MEPQQTHSPDTQGDSPNSTSPNSTSQWGYQLDEPGASWDPGSAVSTGSGPPRTPDETASPAPDLAPRPRRRVRLPVVLFALTCGSTFMVGALNWSPILYLLEGADQGDLLVARQTILRHAGEGLTYMVCLLAILMTHEMGHFLATIRYRIPASLPYFLPFPLSPIGTFGAVISMEGMRANRKEMFDIGIAGPLAGLVVAFPVMWIGVQQLDVTAPPYGQISFEMPLLARLMTEYLHPQGANAGTLVSVRQANPYFVAGWVGLLITGLNMLPVSQLDGGHVIYALFGRLTHWLARGFMVLAIAYMVYSGFTPFAVMAALVLIIGVEHPPTSDDTVQLGWFRFCLGCLSLLLPVLCLTPTVIVVHAG